MFRQTLLFILITVFIISCSNNSSSNPNPEITGVQPTSGPPGSAVTISGNGFAPQVSGNEVAFNGTVATVTNASDSELTTTVPNDATSGVVSVMVGQATAMGPNFTVEEAAPGIIAVDPDSGIVGTEVTITGINFSSTASENIINFNGTNASIRSASDTELVTEVPQGATDGPIEVSVNQKSAAGPNFDVITDGTLEVITETTGSDLDNDGYSVILDNDNGTSIGINDTLNFVDLESGSYRLELTDMATNCSLSSTNPRTENITPGETTLTTFQVICTTQQPKENIVFQSDRDGDDEIFLMEPDGNNPQKLTDNTRNDWWPKISNDGSKIVFFRGRDLYIMSIDGTNVQQLTDESSNIIHPSWSSDDSKILFSDDRGGNYEIYSINTDGSNLNQITNSGNYNKYSPSMSPDGSKIAFQRSNTATLQIAHIYTINPDGTNLQKITNTNDNENISSHSPSWSPDGSKLAFYSDLDGDDEIYIMNPDGSGLQKLTDNSAYDSSPAWSPDGLEIIFDSERDGSYEIYKIKVDGSGTPVNLTTNSADDQFPDWN